MNHVSIDHVLLTRFNLPSAGPESLIRAKEGWLRIRIELFEKFCLPSVLAQTNKNFHWIIYLDPESPEWLKERMASLNESGVFRPIYRSQVSIEDRQCDLKEVSGGSGRVLLTTNLDNDDALAADFVERIQQLPLDSNRTAIYFANGLIRQGSNLYVRRDKSNAFCSVGESWDNPLSCWADWHNRLALHMPVLSLGGDPAWLQTVHTTNVSNRIRGKRAAGGPYIAGFGALLDGTEDPDSATLLREAIVERPLRTLRDGSRWLVKNVILKTLGKDGLDRIKAIREVRVKALTNQR